MLTRQEIAEERWGTHADTVETVKQLAEWLDSIIIADMLSGIEWLERVDEIVEQRSAARAWLEGGET